VEGTLALMEHPDAVGEVFNIGNTHGITIEDLAKKVKEMTGSSSEIVTVPYAQAYGEGFEDMLHRVPDITKIHALTGFTPKVALDEILRRVIDSARTSNEAKERIASGRKKILVIDDEEHVREVVRTRLVKTGYDVVTAPNGKDGIAVALHERPDLILMDVMMPVMDGFEAAKHFRSRVETASIPLVLLTAKDDKESKLRGFDAGIDDYICKPFEEDLLLARIRSLLKNR
jgi:CheY-like chemotaxis protein